MVLLSTGSTMMRSIQHTRFVWVLFVATLSHCHPKEIPAEPREPATAKSHARSIMESCQQQQQQQQSSASSWSLKDCVQQELSKAIASTRQDISQFREDRTRQGSKWEDFACEDHSLPTSPALRETTWKDAKSTATSTTHPVKILHEYTSSQIHLIEDFISPEECQAIQSESEDYLHRAKVHDGKGGDHFSDHRKAWQAGIEIDWEYETFRDDFLQDEETYHRLAQLSRRVYDYTNHVLPGLNISHEGQENLMSIQYFGSQEENSTEPPDRYAPHCDGECKLKLTRPYCSRRVMVRLRSKPQGLTYEMDRSDRVSFCFPFSHFLPSR